MTGAVGQVFLLFITTIGAVVALALLHRPLAGKNRIWFGVMGVMGVLIWFLPDLFILSQWQSPLLMRIATVSLYLAGCLTVMETFSLLSRGISLRVLLDLLDSDGVGKADALGQTYGDGMGLSGLLSKRLDSMVGLGLVRRRESLVGPLSARGLVLGKLAKLVRDALKLGEVG